MRDKDIQKFSLQDFPVPLSFILEEDCYKALLKIWSELSSTAIYFTIQKFSY